MKERYLELIKKPAQRLFANLGLASRLERLI